MLCFVFGGFLVFIVCFVGIVFYFFEICIGIKSGFVVCENSVFDFFIVNNGVDLFVNFSYWGCR